MNVIKDVMFEGRILQVTEKALEFVGSQIVEAFMLYATIRNTKLGGNCGGTTPVTTTDSTIDTSTVATILAFCAQPKSREEIMTMCGLKNKNHFIKAHLKPLLESGARMGAKRIFKRKRISISLPFCLFLISAYRKLPCPARMPNRKKAGAAYLAASRPAWDKYPVI